MTVNEINTIITQQNAILLYFSHDQCSVCKVLKPKISQSITENFPKIALAFIDLKNDPQIAANFQVFTAPTILLFFEGKEHFRFVRNLSIEQFNKDIKRTYQLLFE